MRTGQLRELQNDINFSETPCIYVCMYLPTFPYKQEATQGLFFYAGVWIQSFPSRFIAILRLKSLVCPTILPIAERIIAGFMPFPKVLTVCEMQIALSGIWTLVTTSYDDHKHPMCVCVCIYLYK